MSWSDWINIAGSVVDIAGQIGNLLGEEDRVGRGEGSDTSFLLGDVKFGNSGGTLYAYNASQTHLALNFALVQNQPGAVMSTTTAPLDLPVGQGADISNELTNFIGGRVAISPIEATEDNGISWLGFSIGAVALSASLVIVGGINASFSKTNGVYSFSITSTNGARLQSARVKVRGKDGGSVDTSMTFSNTSDDGSTGTIDLPPGLNIDPTLAGLDITLGVDSADLRRILDANRRPLLSDEFLKRIRSDA